MEQAFYRDYQADAGAGPQDDLPAGRHADEVEGGQGVRPVRRSRPPSQAAYGSSKFGEGCLLARRLVEAGVPFVEVTLGRLGHAPGQLRPRQEAVRAGRPGHVARWSRDLKERGLLDSTLVIWMGEFGRTPKINTRGAKPGRDHYPRAWSTRAGRRRHQGRPGRSARPTRKAPTVVERPISALDFLATVCKVLGIDYTKQNNAPIGRPIRIVDKGANADQGIAVTHVG